MDKYKFDVFISHNSKDKPSVRELTKKLKSHGISYWLDEEQIKPGDPSRKKLEEGITDSRTAAILIGKDGLGPWEDPEMDVLLEQSIRNKKRVMPVLLPGLKEKPQLPLFLARLSWVDLRGGLNTNDFERFVQVIWQDVPPPPPPPPPPLPLPPLPLKIVIGFVVSLIFVVSILFVNNGKEEPTEYKKPIPPTPTSPPIASINQAMVKLVFDKPNTNVFITIDGIEQKNCSSTCVFNAPIDSTVHWIAKHKDYEDDVGDLTVSAVDAENIRERTLERSAN